VRSEIFTRTFPRCGIPEPFESWAEYERFVALLARTETIAEPTQLWWSVRPHHAFGTVEVRICDAQTRGDESFALAGLIAACVAQTALEYDEHGYDGAGRPLRDREIEENLWRAIRYGLDGSLLDFRRREEIATGRALEELLARTEPARRLLGIDEFPLAVENGAQRQRRALTEGRTIEGIYREQVEETRRTYVAEEVLG
jgi:carboxylate-amine ligase